MWPKVCKSFLGVVSIFAFFAVSALANNHRELNGTWQLVPARSELHGEPAVETGTVTINDREGNIYVERSFDFEDANRSVNTNFATDARAKASIKQPGFKSKAKWDHDVLKVTTINDGVTTVERYILQGGGSMMLQVDRTGRPAETLYFQRQ